MSRDGRSGGGSSGRSFIGWRAGILIGLCALLSYGAFLVATAPARLIGRVVPLPPEVLNISGTVWSGEVAIKGGFVGEWDVDAWSSLLSLSALADWSVTGPATRLSGGAAASLDEMSVTNVSGIAGWTVVTAFAPNLPIACDPTARLNITRIVIRDDLIDAEGRLDSGAGLCTAKGRAQPVEAPALTVLVTPTDAGIIAVLHPRDGGAAGPLADTSLSHDARLIVRVFPDGARLVPGMPSSGVTELEMPLGFKFRVPPVR